ncbi:MAG: endonuclease III [Deltaproteobacteria bacterium]|nr:endonuclease III [Deltaproteobacteria bacterium]
MASPSTQPDRERLAEIIRRLKKAYPKAKLALEFSSPLELLVALILAAQCTDARVNEVSGSLFKKYRTARDYAGAGQEELEQDIRPTGFYRNKAKAIRECCRQLVASFNGEVPNRLEDLVSLRGVGRKTANIVLGNAFGIPGIGVDTHVLRLAQRLGFSRHTEPDKVEAELTPLVAPRAQVKFCHLIQAHGRAVCLARKPACVTCVIADLCPYPDKTAAAPARPKRPAFGRKPGEI